MTTPELFGIRCDRMDMLDQSVADMQQRNSDLTIDDCLDAIFAIGLLAVSATFTTTEKK